VIAIGFVLYLFLCYLVIHHLEGTPDSKAEVMYGVLGFNGPVAGLVCPFLASVY
jgi:hypothetical protein